MDNNLFRIIGFSLVMLFITIAYMKKKRYNQIGLFVLLLYTFSSLSSIVFYLIDFRRGSYEITYLPYILWLSLFLIIIYPIFKYCGKHIEHYRFNYKFGRILCSVCLFLSILPLVEETIQFNTLLNLGVEETLTEIHDDVELRKIAFSLPGKILYLVLNFLYPLVLISFIPLLKKRMYNRLAIAGVISTFAVINMAQGEIPVISQIS